MLRQLLQPLSLPLLAQVLLPLLPQNGLVQFSGPARQRTTCEQLGSSRKGLGVGDSATGTAARRDGKGWDTPKQLWRERRAGSRHVQVLGAVLGSMAAVT